WQQWHERTAGSAIQAEAAVALAHALTTRTASILLDQYHGAFESALASVREALDRGDLRGAETLVNGLPRSAGGGQHPTPPWRGGRMAARAAWSTPWQGSSAPSFPRRPERRATW